MNEQKINGRGTNRRETLQRKEEKGKEEGEGGGGRGREGEK